MSAKQDRFSYSVAFKLNVITFAKEHGNMVDERHFGPPQTEKMIRTWRKQEEELLKLENNKHLCQAHAAKWPKLESEVKKWITDHRNNGISVSTKIIICKARRWVVTHNINDSVGTEAWCYCFMKRQTKHA
jgi:predicted Holliday junction resolvase-like endonuclease